MLEVDEPHHTRLRNLVNMAFTPTMVQRWRPRIQALSSQLVDSMQRRRRIELIQDYALPIPTTIIAEIMGVPASDRFKFGRWSASAIGATQSRWAMVRSVPGVWRFMRYIQRLVREKRKNLGDDLTSALIQAEQAGDRLSDAELVAMLMLLLIAGHETTVNLIGNGMLTLLRHADQMQRLRSEPELIDLAIEEMLRYDGPAEFSTPRYAREDIELAGFTIPRGALVFAVLLSANRDERQFVDADVFDIERDPNPHLSFGLGSHYCLGAALARLEGRIAIRTLLDATEHIRLAGAVEDLRWRPGLLVRGVVSLPLEIKFNRKE